MLVPDGVSDGDDDGMFVDDGAVAMVTDDTVLTIGCPSMKKSSHTHTHTRCHIRRNIDKLNLSMNKPAVSIYLIH